MGECEGMLERFSLTAAINPLECPSSNRGDMSQASVASFAVVSGKFSLDQDTLLQIIKDRFPEGATQQQVFQEIVDKKQWAATELANVGSLFQQVSRVLSTADKDGFLDGSETVSVGKSKRTLYRIPSQRLKPKKTKMEIAQEEIERLKELLKEQTKRADWLSMNYQLLLNQPPRQS